MTNFPFEFMFYDNLITWVADEQNGTKKYIAKSDNNKSQQSQLASMGAGASMFGNTTGGFGNANGGDFFLFFHDTLSTST